MNTHRHHMFFYCGLTIIIIIVFLKIAYVNLAVSSGKSGMAIGVGQGSDPRLPSSTNNRGYGFTPLIRRLQGVTAF